MEFVIVTGLSGAGKTRAMHAMEDIGFFCVDNLPPALIPGVYDLCGQAEGSRNRAAVVTDTPCIRITGRLGLTKNTAPAKVEDDLRAVLPPEESNDFCHRLVLHGRAVCTARKAMCENCCMQEFCKKSGLNPPAKKTAAKKNKEQSEKA